MNEVNHRSKKPPRCRAGVARQTSRSCGEHDRIHGQVYRSALGDRGEPRPARHRRLARDFIADLIRAQLAHLGEATERRLSISGPPIVVCPRAAEALGLALHELSTNAVKHGTLSVESGKVEVSWSMEGEAFAFRWQEIGGLRFALPKDRALAASCWAGSARSRSAAHGTLSYDRAGVRYTLATDLSSILG